MPSSANTQKVIQKVRAAMKKDAAPEQLVEDVVRFVASRCAQIVSEDATTADATIRAEFGL